MKNSPASIHNENDMTLTNQPIGLFDSGIGGITVLKEINRLLPHEQLIYFGDTARIPYGNKSPNTIIQYAIQNSRFLRQSNIKLLVIACNTASAHALAHLKKIMDIPVIGVIHPGAKAAASITKNHQIGIIGTQGTINSKAYESAILDYLPQAKITSIACPLFVPLVENNFVSHPASALIIREYLKPFKDTAIDTLVLGCTHYPLLKEAIQKELGNSVTLVDSAQNCANEVLRILNERSMASKQRQHTDQFFVSDDPESFLQMCKNLFGIDLLEVKKQVFF